MPLGDRLYASFHSLFVTNPKIDFRTLRRGQLSQLLNDPLQWWSGAPRPQQHEEFAA